MSKNLRIEFIRDYRCFKKGTVFELPRQCCIVGDNGAGKTTLLSAIRFHAVNEKNQTYHFFLGNTQEKEANVENFGYDASFSYSTSTDNPSTVGQFISELKDRGVTAGSLAKSSGQSQVWNLVHVMNRWSETSNSLLILDEPEISIDFKHRIALIARIKRMMEQNRKAIIVCSHSPDLMRMFPKVFVIPTGEVIDTEEYIERKEMEPVAMFLNNPNAKKEDHDEYRQVDITQMEDELIKSSGKVTDDIWSPSELASEEKINKKTLLKDINRLLLVVSTAKSKPEFNDPESQTKLDDAILILNGVKTELETEGIEFSTVREALAAVRQVSYGLMVSAKEKAKSV